MHLGSVSLHRTLLNLLASCLLLLHDRVEKISVYLLTLLIGDPILCSRIEFLHLRGEAFLLNALHLHLVRQMIELVLIEFLLLLHLSLESLLLLE